ncbi:Na(+)/H(+) antiporter subunit C [Rhodococcus sp. X156]|uniref:Na(+)/H(+) antiporter subunit C n=1 Tax=Rhodococcus sp. X156 TaxID=2499145 RepID=UPI000FDA83B3|nr:Na(+)/H(+) antiporter subunit C [Rhodococcus sp. X156]
MTANLGMLVVIGVLYSCGIYLLIERSVTRLLLGVLLIGNATNLLLLTSGGPSGSAPIVGRGDGGPMADPLAQGMILTSIVITMGLAAFVLALTYRAFRLNRQDLVENDPESAKISRRSLAEAPDRDRSDDPVTGEPAPEVDESEFDPSEFDVEDPEPVGADGVPGPGGRTRGEPQ